MGSTAASTALAKFLKDNPELSQEQFGKRIGIKQASVSKIASGAVIPSLSMRIAIEKETGIPVEDWGGEIAAYLKQKRRRAG